MKISTRLFLYISILLIMTSVGLGYISVRDERYQLMEAARAQARTLARTLAATFKYYHLENQHQRTGELIHAVMPHGQDFNNMVLYIYDRHGQRMDFSFKHGAGKIGPHKNQDRTDILTAHREQLIKDGSHEYFSVLSPIKTSTGELQGAVEVLLSLDKINKNVAGLVRKFVIFILITFSLLAMLIYFISRWSISLPIARLKEASEKLAHGDLALRIEKSGVTELDDLIDDYNRMAHNIERQNNKKEQLFGEKMNLEKRLRHADKLASIGQLASGLAHEIGTPLNVISGRAEHLLGKLTDDQPGAESLKIIIRQSESISKTMRQLLAFSRKSAAHFHDVDLEKIIKEAFSLCQLRQRKTHPSIKIEMDLSERSMMADEDGLRQLFVNLMLNSFHSLPAGGALKVTSMTDEQNPKEIIIYYEDNGPGVPAETRERIFDPFFTSKDVGEGTGLGLFIVVNIVQEHQGRIELAHDFTQGARFILHFPRQPVLAGQPSEPKSCTVPASV